MNMFIQPNLRRQIAITSEHGSWVFLLSPLIIGLFAGENFSVASLFLILAALAAFLIRQPLAVAVKAYSGRRSKKDLPAARFWILIYGAIVFITVAGMIFQDYGYLVYLGIPGVPVFIWHLLLISRRQERRQMGIELVASGVLALTAPAAFWVGRGAPDQMGWWLWLLTWLQSAASIVYAYLRLEQRVWKEIPPLSGKILAGRRALLYTSFNLVLAGVLAIFNLFTVWLILPFGIQWFETLWGSLIRPAIGYKPTHIGIRQLIVSSLFTIIFIIVW
jgi:hypothetical protein